MALETYVSKRLCINGEWASDIFWQAKPPGKASYHYSNAGFTLLGYVLECATGTSLPKLARIRIFDILGMDRTRFTLEEYANVPHTTADLAHPHRTPKDRLPHYGVAEWPAAQMRSSAEDLAKYLAAFMRKDGSCPLFQEAAPSLAELFPPDFCNGKAWWGKDTWYGEKTGDCWSHGGFMEGVRTHIYFWPAYSAGLIFLGNSEGDYSDIVGALKAGLGIGASNR